MKQTKKPRNTRVERLLVVLRLSCIGLFVASCGYDYSALQFYIRPAILKS